ncbi:two component, sigma54 specific, transcriptional regulator, Fis family [Candidatus Moduliflexus flocculans]|uniref:Two component, sigma54 specific, transcriptional regulator, Fis family n=1 Tax=Candidatus Moduliflexus flocculans TaxID=1499966 RepID=A0A0S6VQD9_9BACT|nr:two component, sigma54 specific, transcriptional regulator, Fis family [Candidatus Moduliflexus flocculans]
MPYTILIVDDELEMCLSSAELLQSEGYRTLYTTDPAETLRIMEQQHIDLLLMDLRMPHIGGIDLLKATKKHKHSIAAIMMTGYPTVEDAVAAMRYGALNVYLKPLDWEALLKEIRELSHKQERKQSLPAQSAAAIVTQHPAMQAILRTIDKAAPAHAPVLITGESGTGKELVANSIHSRSARAARPFVRVNCAALPDDLLESELFGHEKGAFTGAIKERKGRFELANTGTIFLDEIGDMSLKTQAKILRVLQEREFERLGGATTLKVDIRILAATNKPLQQMIQQGKFREDLYYRLSVITFHLPPLRERGEDALLLASHFLRIYNPAYHKTIQGFSDAVRDFFRQHQWPGNVRELKNCIERAVIFCEHDTIDIEDLASQYAELIRGVSGYTYADELEQVNRDIILDALDKSDGVKQKAADLLNISRRTLYNRMKKFGIS